VRRAHVVAGVRDWNGDGRPDIVAKNATGTLYMYPGNGTLTTNGPGTPARAALQRTSKV
jgi:hypothetical protein